MEVELQRCQREQGRTEELLSCDTTVHNEAGSITSAYGCCCYGIQFVDSTQLGRLGETFPSLCPALALLHFYYFLQCHADYAPAPAVSGLPLGC